MIAYADTSWWLAYKCSDDLHHGQAIATFDRWPEVQVVWTPWQRVEVFNSLRQAERAGVIAAGKSRELLRALEEEIRLGYWPHLDFDWRDAVRTACELSAAHGTRLSIRGMDLFHVAIAIEIGADGLLSFDTDQAILAKAAGVPVLEYRSARRRRPAS